MLASASLALRGQLRTPIPGFYEEGRDMNPGPYACTAGILPTELSPKPTEYFLGCCCESTDGETHVPRGPAAIRNALLPQDRATASV